jgi:hypothetical protein
VSSGYSQSELRSLIIKSGRGCDEGDCINHGSPIIQKKGYVWTNYGTVPVTSHGSVLCK